jgi:hypothetical protein
MGNLTSMAMLAHLKIEMIGMKAKDADATRGANKHFNASDAAGSYQKCKITTADLRDVIKFAGQARNAHMSFTMPFGNNGWRILPAKRVIDYTNEMSTHKTNFDSAVTDVVNNWPNIVTIAQGRLPGTLFNPGDYPAQSQVAKYFKFSFDMMPIPEKSHFVLDIEQEMLQDLQDKLELQQKEGLERAMADVWRRLYDPVKNMARVLSEDRKIFTSMIVNIEEIVELLPVMNLAGDSNMTMLAAEIKQQLLGHTAGQIKDDDVLKARLAANATDIMNKMNGYVKIN